MFEMLQHYVVVMAAILSTGYLLWCMKQAAREAMAEIRKYRGRKLVALAEKLGPWLYYHEIGHVVAVCRASDLKGTLQSQKNLKPWEPILHVQVRPTFTFCDSDALRNKMHIAATRDEVKVLVGDGLVEKITGYSRKSVDKTSFEKALKLLIRQNSQLFVPFSKELSEEEGQKQMNFYGSTPPLDQVREYLVN